MNNSASLSDKEKSLLLACLKKHQPELVEKAILLDSEKPSHDVINDMRSVLISESVDNGFDSNWDLNEYGAQLEHLIEHLGALYLWPKRKK